MQFRDEFWEPQFRGNDNQPGNETSEYAVLQVILAMRENKVKTNTDVTFQGKTLRERSIQTLATALKTTKVS